MLEKCGFHVYAGMPHTIGGGAFPGVSYQGDVSR